MAHIKRIHKIQEEGSEDVVELEPPTKADSLVSNDFKKAKIQAK